MKILLFSILIIFCSFTMLFADEIYLNDLKIIKCRIIQITDKTIEYMESKEAGGRPFVTIQKDLVYKLVYDDGRVEQISGKDNDKILTKDGSVIEGKIVQVTPEVIIYIAAGSDKKEAIVRDIVKEIVYSDGVKVQISEAEAKSEIADTTQNGSQTNKEEAVNQKGGFINSIVRFGFIGGFGYLWGDLNNKENHAYNRYKNQIPIYPQYPLVNNQTTIEHDRLHGGFELGFLFPAVKFEQKRGFGLSGIKFGIISNYVYSLVDQSLDDDALGNDTYSGTLLKYKTVNIGPEMNIIFSPLSNRVNLVLHFYLLGGYIHQGELKAVPGSRDAGLSLDKSVYSTNFTGYSGAFGTGVRFVSNRAFPVITGIDLQYTYSKIKFDHALPVYNGAENSSFDEIGLIISFGIHI